MSDIRTLTSLREEVRDQTRRLDDSRQRRDSLCAWLVNRGWDAQWVGAAAGLAPSYVELLAKRARQTTEDETVQA